MIKKFATGLLLAAIALNPVMAQNRIKDMTTIAGVRANQLYGYGVVIGLDGTGDKTNRSPFTSQTLSTMLEQEGITLPDNVKLQTKNTASVMITAVLPPFSRPGQTIDVTVSSIGDAKSLKGGVLLVSPLKGVDGEVYALAQGNLVVGGAVASEGGTKKKIAHPTSGRIPNGALIEKGMSSPFDQNGTIQLELVRPDFADAFMISELINSKFGEGIAQTLDGRTIDIQTPEIAQQRVAFIAKIQNMEIQSSAPKAKIIVNSKTGSVAITETVKINPIAVSHGAISVEVTQKPLISQPAPFSNGETVVANQTDIKIEQAGGEVFLLEGADTLNALVKSLNQLKVSTDDLISILDAVIATGSVRATLEVI